MSRILASGGNFNDLVCSGRWRRRSNSSSPRRQQSMPSGWSLGAAATAAQNSTGLRCLYNVRTFYPKYLKQLDNKTAAKTLGMDCVIYNFSPHQLFIINLINTSHEVWIGKTTPEVLHIQTEAIAKVRFQDRGHYCYFAIQTNFRTVIIF